MTNETSGNGRRGSKSPSTRRKATSKLGVDFDPAGSDAVSSDFAGSPDDRVSRGFAGSPDDRKG